MFMVHVILQFQKIMLNDLILQNQWLKKRSETGLLTILGLRREQDWGIMLSLEKSGTACWWLRSQNSAGCWICFVDSNSAQNKVKMSTQLTFPLETSELRARCSKAKKGGKKDLTMFLVFITISVICKVFRINTVLRFNVFCQIC